MLENIKGHLKIKEAKIENARAVKCWIFSKINHQGYEAEMKRHNKALELLAKSNNDDDEFDVQQPPEMETTFGESAGNNLGRQ